MNRNLEKLNRSLKLKFVYLAHSADRRASKNTEVPDYKNIENKGEHSSHQIMTIVCAFTQSRSLILFD